MNASFIYKLSIAKTNQISGFSVTENFEKATVIDTMFPSRHGGFNGAHMRFTKT
jgi:hypothetical protein